jgi:hypothetical protein
MHRPRPDALLLLASTANSAAEPRRHPAEPPHSALGDDQRAHCRARGAAEIDGRRVQRQADRGQTWRTRWPAAGSPTLRSRASAGNSPAIIKPSVPIAKEPRPNQRSGFSDLGIEAARDGSGVPRRIPDQSACVWPVKCGVVFLDVVEIDGAECRQRLP